MDVRYIVGVDPGIRGGVALIETETSSILVHPLPECEMDCVDLFQEYAPAIDLVALEKVHSFPGRGVKSTWTFGQNYGFLRGVILSLRLPLEDVLPQTWMKALNCMSGGDKKYLLSVAQQMYPKTKLTLQTCDAALIATWAKRSRIIINNLRSVQFDRLPIVPQIPIVKGVKLNMACKDKGKDGKRHERMESTKKGGKKKK